MSMNSNGRNSNSFTQSNGVTAFPPPLHVWNPHSSHLMGGYPPTYMPTPVYHTPIPGPYLPIGNLNGYHPFQAFFPGFPPGNLVNQPPYEVGATHNQSGPSNTSISSISGLSNLHDSGSTALSADLRGIRYSLLPKFDSSFSHLPGHATFTHALMSFNKGWVCRISGTSYPPSELVPSGKRPTPRTVHRSKDKVLTCLCSCQKLGSSLLGGNQSGFYQLYFVHTTSAYHLKGDRSKTQQLEDHFIPRDIIITPSLPPTLCKKVDSILWDDPSMHSHEVIQSLMLSDHTDQELSTWMNQHIYNNYKLVVDMIKNKQNSIIQEATSTTILQDSVFVGNSMHSITVFVNHHSIYRYSSLPNTLVDPETAVSSLTTLSSFIQFWRFKKEDEVLTIPIGQWDPLFNNINLGEREKQEALACVVFLTPAMLWAVHQIVHSPTHCATLVWFIDGYFKFTRTRRGEGCLITQGFVHLEVKPDGSMVRSFVPTCHCLAISESAAATFVAVKFYHKVLKEYVGYALSDTSARPLVYVKDMSKGLHKGLQMAFPDFTPVACIEHVRAIVSRQVQVRLDQRSKGRLLYDIHLLHQCPTHNLEKTLLKAILRGWEQNGLQPYARHFIDSHLSPESSNPIILRHSATGVPGISNESQSLENYFGRLSGSSRQQRVSVVKRNAGIRHFLSKGIHTLAKYDSQLCNSKTLGRWSDLFHHRTPPQPLIIQALLLGHEDIKTIDIPNMDGFLVNKTSHIGRVISDSMVTEYFQYLSNVSPSTHMQFNPLPHGPTYYLEKVSTFCWVRQLSDVVIQEDEGAAAKWKHISAANIHYVCNCICFWKDLVCPATMKVSDIQGANQHNSGYVLQSMIKEHHRGRSQTNRTPGRRRAPLPPRRPDHESLLVYFNLPHDFHDDILIFIKESTVPQLEKVLKAKRVGGTQSMNTKLDKVAAIVAGTHVGEHIVLSSISTRHSFICQHHRSLNELRSTRGSSIFPPDTNEFGSLLNPFPQGIDTNPETECNSYLTKLDTICGPSNGKVHSLSLCLCIFFVYTGGEHYFNDMHGQFPRLSDMIDISTVKERMTMDSLSLFNDNVDNRCLDFLQEQFISHFTYSMVPGNLDVQDVELSVTRDADIDQVTEELIQPFIFILSQQLPPSQTSLAVALLVGPVGLYLFRVSGIDESSDEDSVFVVLRPYNIRYVRSGCSFDRCTLSVCKNLLSLQHFLTRILDLPPTGSTLGLAVAPLGSVTVRFYTSNQSTKCTDEEANYGLSLDMVASDNASWISNNNLSQTPVVRDINEENGEDTEDNNIQGNTHINPANRREAAVDRQSGRSRSRLSVLGEENGESESEEGFNNQNQDSEIELGDNNQNQDPQSGSDSEVILPQRQDPQRYEHFAELRASLEESDNDSAESSLFSPNLNITRAGRLSGTGSPSTIIPLPDKIQRHPHRSFFENHHDTFPFWTCYEIIPFPIEMEVNHEQDVGEDLANRVSRATGVVPRDTDTVCVFCMHNINTVDDVAESNRCSHQLHSSCCRQWFLSKSFPSTEDSNDFSLTSLVPMGPCPTCRVVGRWKNRHDNQWIPHGDPVYGIHKCYKVSYQEGIYIRGQVAVVTHIHSPHLYAAIDLGGHHIMPEFNLHPEDCPNNQGVETSKLGHKMYIWSLSNQVHACVRCKKSRPWSSLYKWNDCKFWCAAVQCMGCCTTNIRSPCPTCQGNGDLLDYDGSPFRRSTRRNRASRIHN